MFSEVGDSSHSTNCLLINTLQTQSQRMLFTEKFSKTPCRVMTCQALALDMHTSTLNTVDGEGSNYMGYIRTVQGWIRDLVEGGSNVHRLEVVCKRMPTYTVTQVLTALVRN